MSDKILSSIFEFLKNFKDPKNNNSFDQQNPNIQVVEKNGNVNLILSVTKEHLDKYEKLAGIFMEGIDKLDGVLSVNVALTSENQVCPIKFYHQFFNLLKIIKIQRIIIVSTNKILIFR